LLSTAVPELAAKIAAAHGLSTLAVAGWPGWTPAEAFPSLARTDLALSPAFATSVAPASLPKGGSAIVADVSSDQRSAHDPALIEAVGGTPLAVIQVEPPDTDSLVESLQRAGAAPTFIGEAELGGGAKKGVVVVDRMVGSTPDSAPRAFRVLAITTVFNEVDILESLVDSLRQDGVEVHLVDNWSTDGTYELATRLAQAGALTLERFPSVAPSTFNHGDLLRKVEAIAGTVSADWVIHHDADERRRAPWSGTSLRDALHAVQRSGFNAIDHTVLTFRPIDDSWAPGADPERHLRHFELEARPDLLLQIKAWRMGPAIDLATSGGHEVRFDGRRVFPYRFLLKHYPLRSQEQAERKVYRERQARWNPTERAKGWHHHYDHVRAGQAFIWRREDLWEFVEGRTEREFLVPFIGGVDVGQSWAAKARMSAIEDDLMRAQTFQIERRLARLFGPAVATAAVNAVRRVAWIVRPFRRAWARWRWRRSGERPAS
jgi:glycosyltransferase involved in cell wall biosynthesis